MRRLATVVLSIFIFTCDLVTARGQQPEYSAYDVAHYTTENGLPQNTVKGISEDENGFLWLLTESSLVRFDGHRFVSFDKSILGLKGHRFFNIQPSLDSVSKFYVCIDRFEYVGVRNGRPHRVPYEENTLKKVGPYKMRERDDFYVSPGIPRMFHSEFFPENFIIPAGGNGNYYHLTKEWISVHKKWQLTTRIKNEGRNSWDYFPMGNRLMHLGNDGIFSFFDGDGKNIKLSIQGDILQEKISTKGKRNFDLFLNTMADQVFIYINKSIYLVSFLEKENVLKTNLLVSGFDCHEMDSFAIYFDQKGERLFLGSLSDGLYVITKKLFKTLTHGTDRFENVYYGQLSYGKNAVLTSQGVVLGMNTENGRVVNQFSGRIQKRLASYISTGYLKDSANNLWYRSKELLYKFSPDGKRIIRQWKFPVRIWRIYSVDGENLWIGTRESGLYYLNTHEGIPREVLTGDKSIPPMEFIHMDPKRNILWVGSGKGLFWVDPKSKKRNFVSAFNGMYVRSIHIGEQGEIWIGTYGDGLWLMKGKKITKFPLDENRYLSSVHCIVEDRNGFFWLPTNKGLFRVAKDQLLNYHHSKGKRNDPFYFYYARESGFNTNEFNGGCQPCAVRTGNDFVSLPSMNGLVWFHPEQIEYDVPDKNIFVDGFEMDDKFYNIDSDTINLPLNLASLKLLVSTPYFGHNDNVKIDYLLANESGRFKLRGRVDMTMEKPALSLSHLPGGTYNLEFRLANGSTIQPFTSKKLTLLSPYYYYETPAFRVFVFLFLCCAVLVIIRYRTRSVEKRNEHLEQLVSQRTEELQNTLGVLMETEKELEDRISKQSGIIASISHDINTPLRYHTLLIEHSKKLLEERNLEGLETVHETLAVSIGQLTTLTNNLLEYIKIQRFESSHLEGLVALHDIVDQKVELFKPILNLRNNRFINELDSSLKVRSNPVLLGIIIHNLLDNAYKYTYQGVILISTEIKEGSTVLTIYNSQGGMPAETIEWLTSRSKDLPRAAGNNKGLGLLIVKEMATILNIRISAIASDADTAISLWFSGNVTGVPSIEEGTPTEN